ncbi:hypothetical protein JQU17_19790 [Ponticoccus sp. SC2-23]|uniref:glycosyltransferase family 32 protein n=1 Tax=Alexandriicola marinus TaxID=2081710 RepID=UPI0013E040AC|nr:glycosyltransferase [Alexandriicola marinus]MBM1222456.1 hypothetical protein [Ponticoccus sp. SC6-9]MBM1226962.1 hypothetical protein [Ponticoccus sp. SC6-15]MBM1231383.1 hypothetical protein [Ponticoccus sp. SC6-38]MBM1235956.1 hypothetical protein [Ponticoccus sp. SC6-45]MBM1240406.1 hypothetical protein [Ponticoccus sp. SC6-49]MBM1244941.1 hypothetical protein [Ponticoccus sp. SC2-64]MBM1249430.1 hypothetical protein [Ponticoccus sp. SC6-42]MBM1253899.1 hypothetical protein [Ponticoc
MDAFSIIIQDRDDDASGLPDQLTENVESFTRQHPDISHHVLFNDEIEARLHDGFPPEVLQAYRTLVPYAYKADLARYCILYLQGGIYFDISINFQAPLPVEDGRLTVFRDIMSAAPSDCLNGLIYSPPGHPALQKTIETCIANVHSEYYGPNHMAPTGPVLFGRCLAMTCAPEELNPGTGLLLNPTDPLPTLLFDHPGCPSRLVAHRRKTGPGLDGKGLAKGNVYGVIWKTRGIYGYRRNRSYELAYFTDRGGVVGGYLRNGRLRVLPEDRGAILYGPGVYLTPGRYRLAIELSEVEDVSALSIRFVSKEAGTDELLSLPDVAPCDGLSILASVEIAEPAHDYHVILAGPRGKAFVFDAIHILQTHPDV